MKTPTLALAGLIFLGGHALAQTPAVSPVDQSATRPDVAPSETLRGGMSAASELDRFSRRVQFGRFGSGLRPEDMEISEIEGDLANELSYDDLVACIRSEIAIKRLRGELKEVIEEGKALDRDLNRLGTAISNDRMNVKGTRATPQRVHAANDRIETFNALTEKINLMVDLHDALRGRLDGVLVDFNVNCVGRPFEMEAEMRARAEVTGEEQGRPRLAIRSKDEAWPDLKQDR